MNANHFKSILCILAIGGLSLFPAKAQHYGTTWDGGTGTWNATNANWDGSNVYFNSNNRTNDAAPTFSNGGGTVTVDDSQSSLPITTGLMEFYNAGNWTFQGDAIDSVSTDYQAIVVQVNPGAGNVTFNNTINITPNPTNGGSVIENQSVGTTLTMGNLNISSAPQSGTDGTGATYTNESAPFSFNNGSQTYTVNSQTPLLFASNGATIVINGNITTDPNLYAGLLIGNYGDSSMATGTYIFKGNLSYALNGSKQFDFGSGNILFDTSNTGTGGMTFVGAGANLLQTLETVGNQTISNPIWNQGASNAEIGVSDNGTSTFSGYINAGGSAGELDLHAAAGGTAYFTGQIDGDNNATTKDGAGTVVITHDNTYTSYIPDAFEMKAGTTLIENDGKSNGSVVTSAGVGGDAFGNGANGGNNSGNTNAQIFVKIDSGATLGGTGYTFWNVQAQGATSRIDPGVPVGTAGFQTFNALHLEGGITATSGLTMDFKINSLGSGDYVDLNQGNFTLGGTVTLNFTSTDGGVSTDPSGYVVATGTGGIWDDSAVTSFVVNAPVGYTGTAFFNEGSDQLTVSFTAAPEPSTYALMGIGLLALVVAARRMRGLATL